MVKAKVIKAYLDKPNGVIVWEVLLDDGKMANLVWDKRDFGAMLKIKAEIPESLIEEFCTKIANKEINLDIGA